MVEDLRDLIKGLIQVIYIVIFVYVGFQVIRAILGGTWESENIIIAGIGILLSGLFVIVGFLVNQCRSMGILEERTRNMSQSLSKLGEDFRGHLGKSE